MSGVSELLLLNLLAEREMYGYELARAIRTTTREAIAVGESVLYPTLHTLEQRGWLRAKRRVVAGRTRVYYSVTSAGKRRLALMNREWRRIADGVHAALGASHG
ncbi:MAG TPA: helix-turn-helix transcriptional regulator [Steroidobacteraceae bacterium]|jgi:PadR family transcriptional regulator PadR